ncbi:hypothetical protein LSH36_85g00030 [Paralvinella palmiformis]|uniref:G-protein coupled receptors family 1 profile domain-containing protein n=1 Tax=Paralvinella palmiformis TaxID=53620 RepID=A0AAD9NCF4_9ANNE|nr:hypothetical protein LSH36_85g00030 [Paralvinella palmiformis]
MDIVTDIIYTELPTVEQERPSEAYIVGRMAFIMILACFIIFGNSTTIYAVIRTKELRKMPTNIYVISLAVTDTLVGVFIICLQSVQASTTNEVIIRNSIYWARAPYYTTVIASTCTLLAIAIDRYIAIVHPLFYKRRMTPKRAILVSVAIWIAELAIAGGTSCYYGSVVPIGRILAGNLVDLLPADVYLGIVLSQICLPVIGNVIVYAAIFISIYKRKRVFQNTDNTKPDKRAAAVTKMMMLILGYLIFAWLPYFCIAPLYGYDDIKPLWYIYLSHLSIILLYTNSAVNPIIYSWMNRDFRKAYKRILTCKANMAVEVSPNNTVKVETTDM